ncbi:hypothetical protein GGR19_001203 [Croceicoccus naphthovorans]|nr:hypothetical protein [Croceicoccus naphthovorans]
MSFQRLCRRLAAIHVIGAELRPQQRHAGQACAAATAAGDKAWHSRHARHLGKRPGEGNARKVHKAGAKSPAMH